jgi:hypothetical protein
MQEVRQIIKEDLGAPPEVLFASFDPVPVASASLAQVHVATGHDGRKLAVKVRVRVRGGGVSLESNLGYPGVLHGMQLAMDFPLAPPHMPPHPSPHIPPPPSPHMPPPS